MLCFILVLFYFYLFLNWRLQKLLNGITTKKIRDLDQVFLSHAISWSRGQVAKNVQRELYWTVVKRLTWYRRSINEWSRFSYTYWIIPMASCESFTAFNVGCCKRLSVQKTGWSNSLWQNTHPIRTDVEILVSSSFV